jgi:opacity protein-like surface antigen
MPRTLSWFLLCLLFTPRAQAAETERLLMLDITPHGVPDEVAASLTDLLELEIERGRLFEVISQQDLRTLIKVEEQKLLLGKDEQTNENLANIANQVDAPFLLASSLGRVGKAYLLSLELLDAKQVKVVRRVSQTLIGDQEELVGSLRSAVLAITLEEKGLAPDISAGLIDQLKIAEKPKTVYLAFSPAYEVPVGKKASEDSILVFRPTFYHLRVEAELPLWPWIRLFGSFSVGTTINETFMTEDNHTTGIFLDGGTDQVGYRLQAAQVSLNFSALRIPVGLGIKFAPDTGRFLPYALAGLGVSWQKYSFDNATIGVLREHNEDQTCSPPFSPYTPPGQQYPFCEIRGQQMKPEGDLDTLGLDATAAAGVEWLLTHHIGIKAEVRYHLTYALKDAADLRLKYEGQSQPYEVTTQTGTETRVDKYYEVFAVQQVHHGVVFSAGMIAYW